MPANLAPQGLRRGLATLGYAEGRDFSIQFYSGPATRLAANHKTAEVLGLALPTAILARADEVIE